MLHIPRAFASGCGAALPRSTAFHFWSDLPLERAVHRLEVQNPGAAGRNSLDYWLHHVDRWHARSEAVTMYLFLIYAS